MLVCKVDRKQMICIKNGVGADFGHGHIYPGDLYECPDCGAIILCTNSRPVHDALYITQDDYIKMKE